MKLISIISKRVIAKWGLPAILLSGLAGFFTTDLSELITWATIARHYADISNFIEQNHGLMKIFQTLLMQLYLLKQN